MQQMGFEVTLNDDDDFEFSPLDEPVSQQQQESPGFPGMFEQSPQGSEYEGAPQDIAMSNSIEKDATVTSSTEGVNNPVYSRRKKNIMGYVGKVLQDILKQEKITMPIEKATEGMETMAEFITRNLYSGKFMGMTKSISDIIKDYVVKAALKGYPLAQVVKYIYKKAGKNITKIQAEMIARTEGQALRTAAREWSYKKADP